MRLGLFLSYWSSDSGTDLELIREAERIGYDSVWAAEAWGSDAVTVLAWIAGQTSRIKLGSAIMQMPARTPAATAMTAMTLDGLSGGRFVLGLGASGPQVVEGWHGQRYAKPLARSREYVAIVRAALAREGPLTYEGDHYRIPYDGPDATGLGKPLKMLGTSRKDLPIYLAAMGPNNVALAAEVADGWLPVLISPERYQEVFAPSLARGRSRGDVRPAFEVAPTVSACIHDDVDEARDRLRPSLALYIGGMGAAGRNFYNDLVCRYGYEDAAAEIQDLYLAGKVRAAMAAVPTPLIDELCLVGPRERIRDRLDAWREIGVGTLIVAPDRVETLRTLAELCL